MARNWAFDGIRISKSQRLILFSTLLCLLGACASSSREFPSSDQMPQPGHLTWEWEEGFVREKLTSLAVVPFGQGIYAYQQTAEERLASGWLLSALKRRSSLTIINEEVEDDKLWEFKRKSFEQRQTRIEQFSDFGKLLGADFVLYGVLSADNDLKGPGVRASIRMMLLEVKNNKVVWESVFDVRNQPLTENLLEFRNRNAVSYPSRSELIRIGINRTVDALERTRVS